MGTILGTLAYWLDPFAVAADLSWPKVFGIVFSGLMLIPYPVMEDRAFNLFGLNAPAWSLFWEYVANVFYALVLWRIKKSLLPVLIFVAGLLLCFVAYRAENLLGGWNGATFFDGGARIFYSFLAGMMVYRFQWIIKNRLGFVVMAALLFLAFIMPYSKWNWIAEPLVVLFYFPLLIALGAGAELKDSVKKICVFSGQISYPLYMTHYAFIWMFGHYFTTFKPDSAQLLGVIISSIIGMIGFAYLAMRLYDVPVRRWLSKRV